MKTSVQEEYLAAGIRKQIGLLETLLTEVESHPEDLAKVTPKLRAIEILLRNMRNAL